MVFSGFRSGVKLRLQNEFFFLDFFDFWAKKVRVDFPHFRVFVQISYLFSKKNFQNRGFSDVPKTGKKGNFFWREKHFFSKKRVFISGKSWKMPFFQFFFVQKTQKFSLRVKKFDPKIGIFGFYRSELLLFFGFFKYGRCQAFLKFEKSI